ncbi:MAG: L-threonylcarbamoyladenylate synthase [Acidobacteriaceae bacterium]
MKTLHLQIDPERMESAAAQAAIARAAAILRAGGTVAFPTETVYGLGANALDEAAVAGIFAAKERPHWDPLIVHVSDPEMLRRVVAEVPAKAQRLMQKFWPGPLTLLLPKHADVPAAVTAGRKLVGVRMPSHPVALALIHVAGVPVAAPSANRFGRTSPTTAAHVLEDLDGRIDAVLDGGATSVGVESTVLDASVEPMMIYRPGAITAEMLADVVGEVEQYAAPIHFEAPESLPSPGVGIRHYAPRARLVLVESPRELQEQVAAFAHDEELVGVMLPYGWERASLDAVVYPWADWQDADSLARGLFAGLRELDAHDVSVIVCPLPPATGVGLAMRDRLQKAARKR